MTASSQGLYTVTGRIQALRRAAGTVNLLEDMQKGAFATGLAAAVSGQAGMVANAASLALYDGEDVEHIAVLIDGQLALGTFEWLDAIRVDEDVRLVAVEELKVDDEVKLVVSPIEDGPLFIHAILREKDQLLWMPYSVDHTRWGWVAYMLKLFGAGVVFLWILLFFLQWFNPVKDLLQLVRWGGVGSVLLMGVVSFLSGRDMLPLGQQAEAIFEVLGVPKFKRFNIKPYALMWDYSVPYEQHKKYVFKFKEALAAHKERFRLS